MKDDNRLSNLQLVTQQQNCKKSAKDRDYTFVSKNHENKRCVRATNITTKEVSYFLQYVCCSTTSSNKMLVLLKMVCEGINNCKSGVSKKDGCLYKFEYIKQDDLPDNYKKSANLRKNRVPSEDKKKHHMQAMKKWQNKEYKCPRCDKTFKNKL